MLGNTLKIILYYVALLVDTLRIYIANKNKQNIRSAALFGTGSANKT